MTNIRPLLFLLLAVSIVGSVACGTNDPASTPTIPVQVVPQIFPFAIPSSGVFDRKWGTYGSDDGQFNVPVSVAVASDGSVYVADGGNYRRRIQKFTSEGVFVSQWGKGRGEMAFSQLANAQYREFNGPSSLAVAFDGSVYVADTNRHRIEKFTSEGVFVSKWGTRGRGDGQLQLPVGVAVAFDGSVYVADTTNHRIQKFTSEGVFVSKWGTGGSGDGEFNHPHGVAVAFDGSVYVSDRNNSRIQQFTSEGVFVSKWGTGDGEFLGPEGVAVASDGSVYVAESEGNRIQKFAPGP